MATALQSLVTEYKLLSLGCKSCNLVVHCHILGKHSSRYCRHLAEHLALECPCNGLHTACELTPQPE